MDEQSKSSDRHDPNERAQAAADAALGDQRGAVVALDPKTGAILAMVSKPSYDPNLLASHDSDAQIQSWNRLTGDPRQPTLNHAINQLYPPGSTFKVITSASALRDDVTTDTRSPLWTRVRRSAPPGHSRHRLWTTESRPMLSGAISTTSSRATSTFGARRTTASQAETGVTIAGR